MLFVLCRGNKKRSTWYFVHWLLGSLVSVVGIFNIYTGLRAYQLKTSKSTALWTILFTAEISFIAFFYLFQDKWEYIKKQGLILDLNNNNTSSTNVVVGTPVMTPQRVNNTNNNSNGKVLLPEPCGKRNALMNLFAQ